MNEAAFLKIPLFQDIPLDDLMRMADELPVETYEPGTYLFRDGDPGENLYVVREGYLEILLAADSPDEMLLKICGPGEYVGEMGLILADGTMLDTRDQASREAFDAELAKAIDRTSGVSTGEKLVQLPGVPSAATLMRSVVPSMRSRRNTSSKPLPPAIRLVASLAKATKRPSAESPSEFGNEG